MKPEIPWPSGTVVEYPVVLDVEFLSVRKHRSMYKVRFSCYWDRGGHEQGLIYLKEDFSFAGFSIGW